MSDEGDIRRTCESEIIGRDGKPMPYGCNLPAGHLGKHAQTYLDEPVAPGTALVTAAITTTT